MWDGKAEKVELSVRNTVYACDGSQDVYECIYGE